MPPAFCNLLSGCFGPLTVGLEGARFPGGLWDRTVGVFFFFFFPVPFTFTRKNGGKHSPPVSKRGHVDAASCLLIPFFLSSSLCSLPPACLSHGCANRSWMTPLRTICTWVRVESLPSATFAQAAPTKDSSPLPAPAGPLQ